MRSSKIAHIVALALTFGTGAVSASVIGSAVAANAAPTGKGNPYRKTSSWRVVIAGTRFPGVRVSPLVDEVEVVEYRDGKKSTFRKRPGRVKAADVKLFGYGPIPTSLLRGWRDTKAGTAARWDVALEVVEGGRVTRTHKLTRTFPRSLSVSPAQNKWTMTLAVEAYTLFD